jgi:hypothetical protein
MAGGPTVAAQLPSGAQVVVVVRPWTSYPLFASASRRMLNALTSCTCRNAGLPGRSGSDGW